MLTFLITTSTRIASISLFKDDIMLGNLNINVRKTHSTNILEQVQKLFEWTDNSIDDVDNVIISKGPGSFTGVRIAMSLIKGFFSLSEKVNIYTVSELEAIYYNAKDYADIVVSGIDSNKEKIYYNIYENGIKIVEDSVDNIKNVVDKLKDVKKSIVFAGDIAINYSHIISNDNLVYVPYTKLAINSIIYYEMYKKGLAQLENIANVTPYYLEKSQAEKEYKGD